VASLLFVKANAPRRLMTTLNGSSRDPGARTGRRATLVLVVSVLLMATAMLLAILDEQNAARSDFGSGGVSGLAWLLLPALAFSLVGWLIASRQPTNRIGRICLTIGLLWVMVGFADAASGWIIHGEVLPSEAGYWISLVGILWVPAVGMLGAHLPLRFPDGNLPSERWRLYSRFCTAVIVLTTFVLAFEPTEPMSDSQRALFDAMSWAQALQPLILLFPLSFIGAIASVFLRYRRSSDERRAQIRWIAFGGAVFLADYLSLFVAIVVLKVSEGSTAFEWWTNATILVYCAIPVAIGFSVLKYRLYDIDLIINKALVYAALTISLGAVYLIVVTLLGQLLRPVTGTSQLAVAGSTLAVAALFRPARTRIQTLIDRRFYRRRFDVSQTLDAFSARMRDEIALESLSQELMFVVQQTMEPAHLSLWLTPVGRGSAEPTGSPE
jgi:hypothetical protein